MTILKTCQSEWLFIFFLSQQATFFGIPKFTDKIYVLKQHLSPCQLSRHFDEDPKLDITFVVMLSCFFPPWIINWIICYTWCWLVISLPPTSPKCLCPTIDSL